MSLSHVPTFYAKDRASWRVWLTKFHGTKTSIWLVCDKKGPSKKRLLSYDDIVEEALCFGWIDSLPRKLSGTQSMLYISKRKPKSEWSQLNKARVEKLIKEKKMHVAGMQAITLAKANGSWSKIDAVENLEIAKDLQEALTLNRLTKTFNTLSKSVQKGLLHKIYGAKKEDTRKKYIDQTVLFLKSKDNV